MKKCEYLKTVRDRAISSEFLTNRVVQEYPIQRGKISIFATFGGHLGFLRKMKKCKSLKTIQDRASLSELFDQQGSTRVSYAMGKNFNFRHFWRPSWILAENKTLKISSKW